MPELVAEPEPAEERLAAHLDSGSSCSDSGCTQEQAEHKCWMLLLFCFVVVVLNLHLVVGIAILRNAEILILTKCRIILKIGLSRIRPMVNPTP